MSAEAWRVGEVLAELEQAEEERRMLQETLEERQRVADLLEAQQSQVAQRELLIKERAEIMRRRLGRNEDHMKQTFERDV